MKKDATYATIDAPLPVLTFGGALLYLPVNTVVRYVKIVAKSTGVPVGPVRLEVLLGPLQGSFTVQPKTFTARTHPATALELLSLHANE